MTELFKHVDPCVAERIEQITALRRDLHAHPERGYDNAATRGRILAFLKAHGIESVENDTFESALFATVEGNRPGPTIALRADMDALPMNDGCGKPYASTVPGVAHTCGHDGHTAWLCGALAALKANNDFPGRVLGIFQPAEELGTGAKAVVDAGALAKYDVAEIYGMHGDPSIDAGCFGFCTGPMQASADFFFVKIEGVGCHGGRPHMGVDPIPAVCELAQAIQTIRSRKIEASQMAVISVCSVVAGTIPACNIVPAAAELSGTIRTFNEDVRRMIAEEITRMTRAVAEAHGCRGEARIDRLTPAVINHPETTAFQRSLAAELFGEDAAVPFAPTMGGEDFAEYQFVVPGTMVRVGVRDAEHAVSLHNPAYDFNDKILAGAATFLAETARRRLTALAGA